MGRGGLSCPINGSRAAINGSKMLGHCAPDDIEPHLVVAVDEPVTHADDLTPGDIRLCCPERGRDLACRLADHFQ
jgi:hypothetical protein